jgi:hypothetical protein
MKPIAVTLALVLAVVLASRAWAQGCQRGGGAAPSTAATGGTLTGNFVPLLTPEVAQRLALQSYRQQMEMAYRQAAYMQQLQSVQAQQEALAQAKEDKRQQRLAAVRQRREADLARREARTAANLARLGGDRTVSERN